MSGFNIQELMSQAKQQYEALQKKMQETIVEGSAGGGTVTVKMDGRKQVLSIKIDPEAVKAGDLEMLQDLITAAINGAGKKVDDSMQSVMGGMLGGMGIPGI
jgi:DNA-binding YbaB/EbfC family protein